MSSQVFGVALGELQAALDSFAGALPLLVGPLSDIATALRVSDDPVLHAAAAVLLPRAAGWPRRPLRGDAHRCNILATTEGPCWIDFEDVCVGPVEWDLASLTLDQEAVDAYPGRVDLDRLEECRDLRRLQVLASLLVAGETGARRCATVLSGTSSARLHRGRDGRSQVGPAVPCSADNLAVVSTRRLG